MGVKNMLGAMLCEEIRELRHRRDMLCVVECWFGLQACLTIGAFI